MSNPVKSGKGQTIEATPQRMVVAAGPASLQAAVMYDNGDIVLTEDIRWQCEPSDALAKLKDMIYERPALFDDIPMTLLLKPSMSTLAPHELIAEGQEEAIEKILTEFDPSDDKDCFSEEIGDCDSNELLYSLPGGVAGFLERCFPTEHISHELTPFLQCILPSASRGKGDQMWADIHGNYIHLAAFRNGHLLLANTWHWSGETDVVYYLIYVWKTLGLDMDNGKLYLSGPNDVRTRVTSELRKYINYVAIPSLPREVKSALSAGLPLSMAYALRKMQSNSPLQEESEE